MDSLVVLQTKVSFEPNDIDMFLSEFIFKKFVVVASVVGIWTFYHSLRLQGDIEFSITRVVATPENINP